MAVPSEGGGGPGADLDPWARVEPESSRRLLMVAIEAFAEQGYHATTTRDIATRAGMSPAALYVHYPSKAALLARISGVGHEVALALVQQAIEQAPDPLSRLRAVVAGFTSWHAEHHRVARVVHYELTALPEPDRTAIIELRRRIERLVEEQISAGVAAGQMRVAHPRRVARAVLSLGVDVARWYHPTGPDSPAAIGALYADLAARLVGAGDLPE